MGDFVVTCAGGEIEWNFRRQVVVAQSTSKAELISASTAEREMMCILKLLKDFIIKATFPLKLYQDNQPAISLSQFRPDRDKLKHK